MKTVKEPNSLEAIERPRSRSQTAAALKLALAQLESSNQRISISAVAAAVRVTPALIHNKYPDIAEVIRHKAGKAIRTQRNETRVQLAEAQEAIRALRNEKSELEGDLRKLASINEALRRQLFEAQAIASAKNVVSLPSKGQDKPKQ